MGNPVLLLVISMAANLLSSVIRKAVTANAQESAMTRHVFNTISSLTAAIALFLMRDSLSASLFTVLLGAVFGLVTALQQITMLQALEIGPLSYTTVIISLSTLIPTLCGAVIWGETIVPVQWIGIVLMLGCFLFSVEKDAQQRSGSFKWLMLCGISFLCTGMIGVMQKWHQSSVHQGELDAFLLIAFAISTAYSALCWGRCARREKASFSTLGLGKAFLALIALGGLCAALNNKLNLYLSGIMDSAVFFPIVNGGGLVLTTLAALVIFRERLTARRWIGMALGVASVILLCNPF